jgi:hypothetical protein
LAVEEFNLSEGVGQRTDRQFLQATMDTLRTLASETDGRAIVNRNDLEAGLKQVVRDSSAYYLLGYNSTHVVADGKFHEIKVKARRSGVQVRARKGYWALTKEDMARALAPARPPVPTAVGQALGTIAEPRRGRYIRNWIGTGKSESGRTRVTFVWEPLPPVPGLEPSQGLSVVLQASHGDRVYFRGSVGDEIPPAGQSASRPTDAEAKALPPPRGPAAVAFEADPGPLQIRITVKGEKGETLDTEVRDVTLPDLTAVQVALSTPVVYRTANAREFQALSANPSPVPTASREFRRTERLIVRFDAYAPGSEVPAVTARVLNRVGKGMADLPVRSPQSPATFYQLDLPLAGFAAGEYLIEIKATGASGEAAQLVAIKITS